MLFRHHPIKMQSLNNQKGVVIVVALFIVALVAAMAYTMMARLDRDIRRTHLLLNDVQAEYYAEGSLAWAIDQLRNNWKNQKKNQLVDVLPIHSPEKNENGYRIKSTIYDMQARYNLNNLSNAANLADFKQLVKTVLPKLSVTEINKMVAAIQDWITPGVKQNALNDYYLRLKNPYRPPHFNMFSVTELRLVKGITPDIYNALSPFITALPETTGINVQTASAPVLMTLNPNMSLQTTKAMMEWREASPFLVPKDFTNLDMIRNHCTVNPDKVTTISRYFLVETTVAVEHQKVILYTLLKRDINQPNPFITMVWQSKGSW